MRTTLTLEDHLARRLKREAVARRMSFKELVNRALQAGLASLERPATQRYRCPTFEMGVPREVNLDKALALAATLEDDEVVRKQALRK